MNVYEQLEYKTPKLSVQHKNIQVYGYANSQFNINIKNEGYGILSGVVKSDTPYIKIDECEFTGDNVDVTIDIIFDKISDNDTVDGNVRIISTGGDKVISFNLVKVSEYIEVEHNKKILNLQQFKDYSIENYENAVAVWQSEKFGLWLSKLNQDYYDIYCVMNEDNNKYRAMENFLVAVGVKQKHKLRILNDNIKLNAKNYDVHGEIVINALDKSYLFEKIKRKYNADWLVLEKEELCSDDFENNTCKLKYTVKSDKIKSSCVEILYLQDKQLKINVKKEKNINVSLNKNSYINNEDGVLYLKNNTKNDMKVSINYNNSLIQIQGDESIELSKDYAVKFCVNFSRILLIKHKFVKLPYIITNINLEVQQKNKNFTVSVPVKIIL